MGSNDNGANDDDEKSGNQIASVMGNGMGMLEEEIMDTIVSEREKKKKTKVKSTTTHPSSCSSLSLQQTPQQLQSHCDQNSKSFNHSFNHSFIHSIISRSSMQSRLTYDSPNSSESW